MPERCADCWLLDDIDGWCLACQGRSINSEYRYGMKDKPDWCPLIEVPTPQNCGKCPFMEIIDRKQGEKVCDISGEYLKSLDIPKSCPLKGDRDGKCYKVE